MCEVLRNPSGQLERIHEKVMIMKTTTVFGSYVVICPSCNCYTSTKSQHAKLSRSQLLKILIEARFWCKISTSSWFYHIPANTDSVALTDWTKTSGQSSDMMASRRRWCTPQQTRPSATFTNKPVIYSELYLKSFYLNILLNKNIPITSHVYAKKTPLSLIEHQVLSVLMESIISVNLNGDIWLTDGLCPLKKMIGFPSGHMTDLSG